MKKKLRIGLLVNGYKIPAWKYRIIDQIYQSEFAEIICVIINPVPDAEKIRGKHGLTSLLIRAIEKCDRLIFRTGNDYNTKKDISSLIEDMPVLDMGSASGNQTIEELKKLKELNPDIIIRFGAHNLNDELLRIPRYGTWGFSTDDIKTHGITIPGFREVINYRPVTYSALEVLSEDPGKNSVLFETWESTCPFSINVNRNRLFWRASLFVPRILEGLSKYGEIYLKRLKERFRSGRILKDGYEEIPTLPAMINYSFRHFLKVTALSLRKLWHTDAFSWELLIDIGNSKESYSLDFKKFKAISPPMGIFWADPFVVSFDEVYYIFVEEFIYRKDKAHISVLELDKRGNLIKSDKIIERPYHMSYPFVFTIGAEYYMIPETCQNRTIELYRCAEFPWKWHFEKNIMENLNAADTTLFHNDDIWWLFTAIDQTDNISECNTELFLFYTDDVLNGEWKSHPMNPVVSDVRNARPAGSLFIQDDKIYRPSQDCSMRYGRGFNLNHVTVLTKEEYQEEKLTRIKPSWDKRFRGMHTINFDNGLTLVDIYSFNKRISLDFRGKLA